MGLDWLLLSPEAAAALAEGKVGDPFALLGPHACQGGQIIRTYLPGADAVSLHARDGRLLAEMRPVQIPGLFAAFVAKLSAYQLHIRWPGLAAEHITEDPYSFGLLLGALDLHLFSHGSHRKLWQALGAQAMTVDGVRGVRFAVWAPAARRVSVVGAFNNWDGRRNPLRRRMENGVWELFIPRLVVGEAYQFEVLDGHGRVQRKSDPLALQAEPAPSQRSRVADTAEFSWHDVDWLANRPTRQARNAPMSIYEVHAASWRHQPDGRLADWDFLTDALIPYAVQMGFTHIELMPVMAHPFGGSWGYQTISLFAPQPEWGSAEAFARFVDACHVAGLGVLLDWVPAHFPDDAHGLARFDGTALYEHADPREGRHEDWDTLIYNFGRHEVSGFLIASALYWLTRFHIDGLRVDAVASMLHRDYSRKAGEWRPNHLGGRENLEAVAFLRALNTAVAETCPGALMIAEESTSWRGVTHPIADGGLGFSRKWNMGWMNDTLHYAKLDPIYRAAAHERITFGLMYVYHERFVLPLSHDEVVHLKGSMLRKQPGTSAQQFDGLRALYGWMWAHPGQKLLFMGNELAEWREWNHDVELDWAALGNPQHRGVQSAVRDLNRLYRELPVLHAEDDRPEGFCWMLVDARAESLFAFCRFAGDAAPVLVVSNFTPVPRPRLKLPVPRAGCWREMFNSAAADYGGSGEGNLGAVIATDKPWHGQPASLTLFAPPLSTLWLQWQPT